MNPALVFGSIVTIGLASAGACIFLGRVFQRVDALEKVQAQPCQAVTTLQQQMKSTEARLKELEADRKAHGEALSEFRGVISGLKETLDRLQEAMRDLTQAVRKN